MKKTVILLIATLSLAACNKAPPAKPQGPAPLHGMKLDAHDQNAKVTRMFAVQGRWVAEPNAANHGHYLVVDIAGGDQYNMDVKGKEGGTEAVFASSVGSYKWTATDVMEGKASSGAIGPLAGYASWQAGFPSEGVMTVRTAKGDVQLRKTR